jgi:hypothetical protein
MAELNGSPEEILAQVQSIAETHLPGIVCELQEYKTQIGCGALDERGILRDVKWRLRGLREYHVDSGAKALASHFARRVTIHGRR